jgi:non-homologous end joining protein Ku
VETGKVINLMEALKSSLERAAAAPAPHAEKSREAAGRKRASG